MTKVVPSQVISLIDRVYPNANKTPDMKVYSADAAVLAAIIELAANIPDELLTISGDDYAKYVFGLKSMSAAIDRWNYLGGDDPPANLRSKESHLFGPRGAEEVSGSKSVASNDGAALYP